jgi:hypothetical protein
MRRHVAPLLFTDVLKKNVAAIFSVEDAKFRNVLGVSEILSGMRYYIVW